MSLYTRIIAKDEQEKIKHYHLEGPKGIFNIHALSHHFVIICEGVFDALSCLSVGFPAVAIFGLTMDWQMVKAQSVLLAFDNDNSGRKAIHQFGTWGIVSGKKVSYLDETFFDGCKDINELFLKVGPLVLKEKIEKELLR
jgi:DNA primase